MNSNNLAVFRIKNTSTKTICGIPVAGNKIVLLNPQFYHTVGVENILSAINDGTLVASDISGAELKFYDAYTFIQSTYGEIIKFIQNLESSTAISPTRNLAIRLLWNLENVSAIVSLVGEDILSTDFSSSGVTRSATISKITPIFQQLSIGQFTEAVLSLSNLATDAFYTVGRIDMYKTMIAGIDSFNFTA